MALSMLDLCTVLHSQDKVFCDLKPRNCGFDSLGNVLIMVSVACDATGFCVLTLCAVLSQDFGAVTQMRDLPRESTRGYFLDLAQLAVPQFDLACIAVSVFQCADPAVLVGAMPTAVSLRAMASLEKDVVTQGAQAGVQRQPHIGRMLATICLDAQDAASALQRTLECLDVRFPAEAARFRGAREMHAEKKTA
jgi:hypothetical protein